MKWKGLPAKPHTAQPSETNRVDGLGGPGWIPLIPQHPQPQWKVLEWQASQGRLEHGAISWDSPITISCGVRMV